MSKVTKQLKIVEEIKFDDDTGAPTDDQLSYMCSQVGEDVPRYMVAATMKFASKNPYYLKYGIKGKKPPTSSQIREAKRSNHLKKEVLPDVMDMSSLEDQKMTQEEANEYVRKQIEDYENTRQKQIFINNNDQAISVGTS